MTADAIAIFGLADHEAVIERGLATFVEVGEALAAIRDERLYRETHGTFEDYCRERWGMTSRRAIQMITAAEVVGTIVPTLPAPANEAQARALAAVPEPEREQVWRETLDQTAGKPTAAAVRRAFRPEPAAPVITDVDREFWADVAQQAEESGAAQRIADERPLGLAAVVIRRTTAELAELADRYVGYDLADSLPDHARAGLDHIQAAAEFLTDFLRGLR